MNNIENILYLGLELDGESKLIAKLLAKKKINELGWNNVNYLCHHMTISFHTNFDEDILVWFERNEGKEFPLAATEIGYSDKALALKVETSVPSTNVLKHITLCTNIGTNGKPKDSNDITQWEKLVIPINLQGIVKAYYKH